MSLARPVLVSDLEPLVEVTGGGERGMLFRAADPDDLAAKLGDAIDGRVDLEAMAGRGFAFAERERSWEACAAQLRTICWRRWGGGLPLTSFAMFLSVPAAQHREWR
ncbi:MAG: glycosyltransferase [Sphingomonas sp.]